MPFHACGVVAMQMYGNDLVLMADSKQNDCLDGVPSPFMADSEQSSGFDGQTRFVLKDSADASQVPQVGCIPAVWTRRISCLPPVWLPKRIS